MSKLWMCRNCDGEYKDDNGVIRKRPGKVFEADEPVCSCGVDGRVPEMANYIAPVETLHFDPPHPFLKDRGVREAACGAGKVGSKVKGILVRATGERSVVNCKACMATDVFKGDATHSSVLVAVDHGE